LSALKDLLSKPTTPPIGLILTERLINIPAEVVPPMYTMLLEEISWAVDDKEPYTFSHYLILSKTYEEVESQLDTMEARPQKKKKRKDAHRSGNDSFYFHPEDEVFERHAMCHGSYDYSKPQDGGHADSKRAFQELGIKPQGQLMLIDAAKFEAAVNDVSNFLQPPV
jgi:protein BCP1